MNEYSTHQEFLREQLSLLDFTKKNLCLEFGTGYGSGEIFKEFTDKYSLLTVVAFESDSSWFVNMKNKYEKGNYIFNFVDSWDSLFEKNLFSGMYEIVFVDQSPWEARIKTIDSIKHLTKTIILHDYNYYNLNLINDINSVSSGSFFYSKYSDYFELDAKIHYRPPTLIMKNKFI